MSLSPFKIPLPPTIKTPPIKILRTSRSIKKTAEPSWIARSRHYKLIALGKALEDSKSKCQVRVQKLSENNENFLNMTGSIGINHVDVIINAGSTVVNLGEAKAFEFDPDSPHIINMTNYGDDRFTLTFQTHDEATKVFNKVKSRMDKVLKDSNQSSPSSSLDSSASITTSAASSPGNSETEEGSSTALLSRAPFNPVAERSTTSSSTRPPMDLNMDARNSSSSTSFINPSSVDKNDNADAEEKDVAARRSKRKRDKGDSEDTDFQPPIKKETH